MPSDATEPDARPRSRNIVGIIGLVLGLGAVWSQGFTALPGVLLCAVGIWKRAYVRLSWAGLVLCIVLGLHGCPYVPTPGWVPDPIQRIGANRFLRAIDLPTLPRSARDIRYRYMGFFAQNLWVRFQVPKEDAAAFLSGLGDRPVVRIGDGEGARQLISSSEYVELYGIALGEGKELDESRYLVVRAIDDFSDRPIRFQRGLAYHREPGYASEDPLGLYVYYDEDTGTVYLYWHWS